MRSHPSRLLLAVVLAVSLATGCGSSARPGATGSIIVFAASSLKESFTELGRRFEVVHPGSHVTFNFGASSTLAQQILQGAPVDAFAAADTSTMQKVVDGKAASSAPVVFAHNVLEIIVAKGNPKKIATVADLARSDLVVVLAAPQVPVGAYAQQALTKAGVAVTPKSLEPDVKAVVHSHSPTVVPFSVTQVPPSRMASRRMPLMPFKRQR